MTNKKNIEDVTNSPKDWEDFWYSPEKHGTWDYYNSESEGRDLDVNKRYVEDVLKGENIMCKRESPLSEWQDQLIWLLDKLTTTNGHFVYPVEGKYALSLMNLLHTLFVGRYTTHGREKSRLHDWRYSCHSVDTVVPSMVHDCDIQLVQFVPYHMASGWNCGIN